MTPGRPPAFDPGLTQKYTGSLLRAINKDGTFNVRRPRGFRSFAGSVYMLLVTMSWPKFLALVFLSYLVVNTMFAGLYVALGPGAIRTSVAELNLDPFALAFFFSVHTLTTVGYGDLYPIGMAANIVSSTEAAIGLMGFALATGLLFARFSRPSPRLAFSERAIIAPYGDGHSLQFRLANQRTNVLMDLKVDVMLMTVERDSEGQLKRNFAELRLERQGVFFLPLTWTVVHPIDEQSPLYGKTAADLERLQAEVMILMRSFDDSFGQVVHSRYSYRWDEVEWAAQFVPAFEVAPEGHLLLDVDRVGQTRRL
jgi:inward rectifier potassium channel